MLSLLAPGWLLGLLSLPWIRWLHRGGRHRVTVSVAHLPLWKGAGASHAAPGERQPPDPAWRRRALLVALFLVALAEPQWSESRTRITLWVDDSLSMLARDERGTRIVSGLAQAADELAALPPGSSGLELVVRNLSDPWRALDSPGAAAAAVLARSSLGVEPGPPPLALLQDDRAHWLVTDGADAALFDWPAGRGPDHVVSVGGVTRNVGIEGLAARRDPANLDRHLVHVRLRNGGNAAETRTLVISSSLGEVSRTVQRLNAGSAAVVAASMPAAATARATLEPADALVADDVADLDLALLQRRAVAVDARCPPALVAAVASHPGLVPHPPGGAAGPHAAVACGASIDLQTLPTLLVRSDGLTPPPRGPLLWSDGVAAAERVVLGGEPLPIAARLEPAAGDTVLLALGATPVIVERARDRPGAGMRLETALDMAAPAVADNAALPLLVNLMFERLLGGPLLDPVVIFERRSGASSVMPVARPTPTPPSGAAGRSASAEVVFDAVRTLLLAALAVGLWEIAALLLQWRRLRERSPAAVGAGGP